MFTCSFLFANCHHFIGTIHCWKSFQTVPMFGWNRNWHQIYFSRGTNALVVSWIFVWVAFISVLQHQHSTNSAWQAVWPRGQCNHPNYMISISPTFHFTTYKNCCNSEPLHNKVACHIVLFVNLHRSCCFAYWAKLRCYFLSHFKWYYNQ